MINLKQRYIDNLDRVLKKLLEQDEINCNIQAKNPSQQNIDQVFVTKIQIETLLLFSNVVLGRVSVNKICKKYKINNADKGGI